MLIRVEPTHQTEFGDEAIPRDVADAIDALRAAIAARRPLSLAARVRRYFGRERWSASFVADAELRAEEPLVAAYFDALEQLARARWRAEHTFDPLAPEDLAERSDDAEATGRRVGERARAQPERHA